MAMSKTKQAPDVVGLGDGVILLHGETARDFLREAFDEVAARVFGAPITAADLAMIERERVKARMKRLQ
jgi:hypothetical protein